MALALKLASLLATTSAQLFPEEQLGPQMVKGLEQLDPETQAEVAQDVAGEGMLGPIPGQRIMEEGLRSKVAEAFEEREPVTFPEPPTTTRQPIQAVDKQDELDTMRIQEELLREVRRLGRRGMPEAAKIVTQPVGSRR